MNFTWLPRYSTMLAQGAGITLILAFFTVIFGTILGTFIALGKLSRHRVLGGPLRFLATAYIEFLRGTPLMVQIFIIFYGLPMIGVKMPQADWISPDFNRYFAGILALSMNSAAYVAEIIRSGIQAVDSGQMEAARSLGMRHSLAMSKIVLPQAVRNILPALGNEFVVVVKESSMVSLIGIAEIMRSSDIIRANTYFQMEPLLVIALIYFIITFTLSKLLGKAERRMRRGD